MASVEAAVALARIEPGAARRLLSMLTLACRTRGRFQEQCAFLVEIGTPVAFLPSASDLGLSDLA